MDNVILLLQKRPILCGLSLMIILFGPLLGGVR